MSNRSGIDAKDTSISNASKAALEIISKKRKDTRVQDNTPNEISVDVEDESTANFRKPQRKLAALQTRARLLQSKIDALESELDFFLFVAKQLQRCMDLVLHIVFAVPAA